MTKGFAVTVNHDITLEQMIEAGHYNWIDPRITSDNFSIVKGCEAEINIVLARLNKSAAIGDVIRNIGHRNFRVATLLELLSFGAVYPGKQTEFPIATPDSIWLDPDSGKMMVPYLTGLSSGERSLRLRKLDDVWPAGYRFAVVRRR